MSFVSENKFLTQSLGSSAYEYVLCSIRINKYLPQRYTFAYNT